MPLDNRRAGRQARAIAEAPLAACVAVPARNEEKRIAACLEALADQSTDERFAVVVLANNCTDRTVRVARGFARKSRVPIVVREVRLDADRANAGHARRLAMNAALELLGPGGALMTTDADSRVSRRWVAANLDEIRAGADLVCGLVTPDFAEPKVFPPHVYAQGALEYLYQRMAADLEGLLDPLPHDPAPRHLIESGASLAVRAEIYRRVGGVPEVRGGEDRAFVDRVRRAGGKVRHSLAARVATSCRLDGRASGGWADDLLRRAKDAKAPCHPVIEASEDFIRRAERRGALRATWPLIAPVEQARALGVDEDLLIRLVAAAPCFEAAWVEIEAASPSLVRRRLPAKDLPIETHRLKKALDRARALAEAPRKAAAKTRRSRRAAVAAERLWRSLGVEPVDAPAAAPRKRRTMFASSAKR
jgi:GT2 family glycosyltransferase